jgi:hypothetical protein
MPSREATGSRILARTVCDCERSGAWVLSVAVGMIVGSRRTRSRWRAGPCRTGSGHCAAADSTVSEDPRIAALSVCESVSRQLERVQVEVVAGLVLLEPQVWAAAEEKLAEQAGSYRPSELAVFALNLITRWIRTGPVSGRTNCAGQRPARVRPRREGERPARRADPGTVVHRPACVVDAPRRGGRPLRRAPPRGDALGEICQRVLDSGDLPQCGGERPHLNAIIGLAELGRRTRAASRFRGAVAPGRSAGAGLRCPGASTTV